MVGAVEQELRAAGDGAEFADDQPVVVNGVVVEDVAARKVPGVVDKIVVYRKFADVDPRFVHHVFQIDDLGVAGPGIDKVWVWNRHNDLLFKLSFFRDDSRQHNAAFHISPLLSAAKAAGPIYHTADKKAKTPHLQSRRGVQLVGQTQSATTLMARSLLESLGSGSVS